MYCDSVGPFFQSAFHPCYPGLESKRLSFKNCLEGKVIPHLHPCSTVGVLSHVLIYIFLIGIHSMQG